MAPTNFKLFRDIAAFFGAALIAGMLVGAAAKVADLGTAGTYAVAGAALGALVLGGIYWIIGRRLLALQNRREMHAYKPAVVTDKSKDGVSAGTLDFQRRVREGRQEHVLGGGLPVKSSARRAIRRSAKRIDRVDVKVRVHGFDPTPKPRA